MSSTAAITHAQVRLLRRLAELGDVGAAAERPRRAGQHDRLAAGLLALMWLSARMIPSRSAKPSAFTGGLSKAITATSP